MQEKVKSIVKDIILLPKRRIRQNEGAGGETITGFDQFLKN
jgi:hypothetical protein